MVVGVAMTTKKYIIGSDVGSSSIRAAVYEAHSLRPVGQAQRALQTTRPFHGWVEYEHEHVWHTYVDTVRAALDAAAVPPDQCHGLAIAAQRNSFLTFDRHTGRPFHDFISWQDLRAAHLVRRKNASLWLRFVQMLSFLLFLVTRKARFLSASVIRFLTPAIPMRLRWVLDHVPEVRIACAAGNAALATIDTWLVYRLTDRQTFATDFSMAAGTCVYDLWQEEWSSFIATVVSIPLELFPPVRDSTAHYGAVPAHVFGAELPILALITDQSASVVGNGCFAVDSCKITLGTGGFIDVNTGKEPHSSVGGLYPLIGWSIDGQRTYLAEGMLADCGNIIDWLLQVGLLHSHAELDALCDSVPDTDGCCFVGAFSGLQAPVLNDYASTLFIGMTRQTTRAQLVRAACESIVFRVMLLQQLMRDERRRAFSEVKVDGGVARSEFVCQALADLMQVPLQRTGRSETTSAGAAMLGALACGTIQSVAQLAALADLAAPRLFRPCATADERFRQLNNAFRLWLNAAKRSYDWFQSD